MEVTKVNVAFQWCNPCRWNKAGPPCSLKGLVPRETDETQMNFMEEPTDNRKMQEDSEQKSATKKNSKWLAKKHITNVG
ncbi:hypothetical protein SCA6_004088 [Theobroma cacao]